MSYLKLPKTTQDHAVGYQSVVQAIDNNAALKELYGAKHAVPLGVSSVVSSSPLLAMGRHRDILIARTVVEFALSTAITPTLTPTITGPIATPLFGTRLAAGTWKIFVSAVALFSAVALLKSTTSVDRKANCYTSFDPMRGPSVTITTWEIDTGVWVPADLPFSLILWTSA